MNLEADPERATQLCCEAQARLTRRVAHLSEDDVRSASLLPGWSVGHVLTHLARNADAHARRLSGALNGCDVSKYERGAEQRRSEIEDGATRSASEIIVDLLASMRALERLFVQSAIAGWPNGDFLGGGDYGVAGSAAHRLREVEMHHVDLGLGYTPAEWPQEYVDWDLPVLLATANERLGSINERRSIMAWLAGRGPLDAQMTLAPW
ncbi:maleylpyruvate isomerase N-terminal domain-containing protein [Arthrobacter cryoconiti]|uniref:Maleylpyruvate isomerase N-terminal domain-containing protein n=1 Tax=Arthrobacter cryoconiti TaxID=748907 RepID=A0ABV8R3J9_9MICC|nr:maleylpyruvate isomerase family mycothiol-dependent enzyme [Arthrobacter cryoconiti]MCC9067292.1 maleylpyruvate isomerase family mycothiol-dependent enzyme [Arthrobacter cryoconiti]